MESSETKPKPERMHNNYNQSVESLCSFCGNACNMGCSWSESFIPVKGWTAGENKNGYFVIECPEFCSDKWMHENPDDLDTEGCVRLMEAFLREMREDYREQPRSRRSIENFLRNPHYRNLFWFCDPEDIIIQFRKEMRHTL